MGTIEAPQGLNEAKDRNFVVAGVAAVLHGHLRTGRIEPAATSRPRSRAGWTS
jgi:hypothetical protein